jgi:hypothetical protein
MSTIIEEEDLLSPKDETPSPLNKHLNFSGQEEDIGECRAIPFIKFVPEEGKRMRSYIEIYREIPVGRGSRRVSEEPH